MIDNNIVSSKLHIKSISHVQFWWQYTRNRITQYLLDNGIEKPFLRRNTKHVNFSFERLFYYLIADNCFCKKIVVSQDTDYLNLDRKTLWCFIVSSYWFWVFPAQLRWKVKKTSFWTRDALPLLPKSSMYTYFTIWMVI